MIFLLVALCVFSQISEKQKELIQLKTKLDNVRNEIRQLEDKKVGTLAHIEKIDEAISLATKYIDEISIQEDEENIRVRELAVEIAQLEVKMKLRKDDLRERLVRLYKWTPFYKLEMLLSPKSLPEVLSTSYYLQLLAHDDHRAFNEFRADWKRYITDREMREDLIATLEARREEKESEVAKLNEEKNEKKRILDRVAREETEKRKLEVELKSAQRKLEELIVTLEKQKEKTVVGSKYLEPNKGTLPWPCQGKVATNFGNIIHPKYNTKTKNNGIDIEGEYGENVYAVAPGKVVYADRFMGYGNLVLIDHRDGFYSLYGHLAEILVSVDEEVSSGRIIGRVGESGSLSGPLLHFELRKEGKPVDPLAYLK